MVPIAGTHIAGETAWHNRNTLYIVKVAYAGIFNSGGIAGWHIPAIYEAPHCCTPPHTVP